MPPFVTPHPRRPQQCLKHAHRIHIEHARRFDVRDAVRIAVDSFPLILGAFDIQLVRSVDTLEACSGDLLMLFDAASHLWSLVHTDGMDAALLLQVTRVTSRDMNWKPTMTRVMGVHEARLLIQRSVAVEHTLSVLRATHAVTPDHLRMWSRDIKEPRNRPTQHAPERRATPRGAGIAEGPV